MELETDGTLSSIWDQASALSNSACSIESVPVRSTHQREFPPNGNTIDITGSDFWRFGGDLIVK